MSDASRPAKRARRTATTKTTTSTTATPTSQSSSAADTAATTPFHLPYAPSRAIPPIAPTPPSQCPLPNAATTLLSRRYDLYSGQVLYRVRVAEQPPRPGGAAPRELDVWLDDILAYVSAAELERFELGYEDDVVVVVDEDGAVLLVSREAQRAMAGWAPAGAEVPAMGGGRRRAPTRAFVDELPVGRRRGRPRKTAAIMGAVDGDADTGEGEAEETGAEVGTATDTEAEGIDYGAWVDPASVRMDEGERDKLVPSETGEEDLGRYRAGGVLPSREEVPAPTGGRARSSRRGTRTGGSTGGSSQAGATSRRNGRVSRAAPAREASIASAESSSHVRQSRSSTGAPLRRSSISGNSSAAESSHSAISQPRSTRFSAAPVSRSESVASVDSGAAGLLTAFRSTQASLRKTTKEEGLFISPNATPKASQQTASSRKQDRTRRTSTVALHQASSMLHPPSEGVSWESEPEVEEEYEIESVIKHKKFAGDTYYLVKWAHYPPDYESWFTAEELEGAREVLDEYLAALKMKRKGKGRAIEPDRNGNEGGLDGAMDDDSGNQNEDGDVDMFG